MRGAGNSFKGEKCQGKKERARVSIGDRDWGWSDALSQGKD